MPVEKNLLEKCIKQAAEGDQELADLMRKKYTENDALAVKFVAGFTATDDYTRKTQELSSERKKIETEVAQYQKRLQDADSEKKEILTKLANQEVSTATAQALLNRVKTEYALTDDDIPGMADLIKTRKTGEVVDSTPDIKTALADFKKEIMGEISKTLIPELTGMSELDLVWDDIRDEHRELTGKRLAAAEQRSLLAEAREKGKSIKSLWEEKNDVPALRKAQERETWRKEYDQEQSDKEKERRSREALEVVQRGDESLEANPRGSRVLRKEFKLAEDPIEDTRGKGNERRVVESAAERQKLSGAERAAKKFLEKGGVANIGKPALVERKTA
jgi:hypothetical protein